MEKENNSEEEISLIDLFLVLYKRKRLITGITLFGMIAAVVISIISLVLPPEKSFLPNKYTSKSVMLISGNESSGLPSNLSSLASLAGLNVGSGGGTNAKLFEYLSSSNLLYDALNERFNFTEKLEIKKFPVSSTRDYLKKVIKTDKDTDSGTFSISFTDIDPEFAQKVVAFSVDWLKFKFDDLGIDENNIKKANLEKNIDLTYQEILRLEQETQNLGKSLNSVGGVWSVPSASIETTKIQMELAAQKEVYTQLKTQYELLKIQMQSEKPAFQILERAEVSDRKSSPSRGKLCIIITFAAFFISVFMTFLLNSVDNLKQDKEFINKLKTTK